MDARTVELPAIAASLPSLNQAYQAALGQAGADAAAPAATLVSNDRGNNSKQYDRAVEVFTDPDPVQAAQRSQSSLGQIASNPLKRLFGRG